MRTALLILATLISQSALAAAAAPAPAKSEPAKAGAPTNAAAASDDDEEDAPPKPVEPAKKEEAAPAPLGAVSTDASPNDQKLVAGAPLYNPNVAVHIVEQKEYTDKWQREIALYPLAYQVNGKFTTHLGLAGAFIWHLQENFALMAMGQWNYLATESSFNAELIDKVRAEAQAATSLLLIGGALGGVEVTPLYGKFVFYDSYLIHFSVVLSAGAGAGMTRHQLKPVNDAGPATFGDTGWRFLAEIGGGFRVQFMKWLTLRLELKDLVYTARVDNVQGCNNNDLKAMDQELRAGRPVTGANVGGSCNVDRFTGVDDYGDEDPSNDRKRSDDVPLAYALVKNPSSDVLNNLSLYLGLSFTF